MKSSVLDWIWAPPLTSIPPPLTEHNNGRTVFNGWSNLGKIAKPAARNSHMVINLTVKGWVPKSGNIEKLCDTLRKLNLTEKEQLW